jgi:hypothetical protein
MLERIPNPFKEEWENLDIEEFKEFVCEIIDDMVNSQDDNELEELICSLDDEIAGLILLLKLKDKDYIEAIKIGDISREKLMQFGFTEEEIDSMDKEAIIPIVETNGISIEDIIGEIPKKKDKKDWLL